jgi:hypothetical protein
MVCESLPDPPGSWPAVPILVRSLRDLAPEVRRAAVRRGGSIGLDAEAALIDLHRAIEEKQGTGLILHTGRGRGIMTTARVWPSELAWRVERASRKAISDGGFHPLYYEGSQYGVAECYPQLNHAKNLSEIRAGELTASSGGV